MLCRFPQSPGDGCVLVISDFTGGDISKMRHYPAAVEVKDRVIIKKRGGFWKPFEQLGIPQPTLRSSCGKK